jgi:beta-lactamase class A
MVGGHRNPAGSTTNAAVFTRSHRPTFSDPAADSVIGKAARLAVDHLSGRG